MVFVPGGFASLIHQNPTHVFHTSLAGMNNRRQMKRGSRLEPFIRKLFRTMKREDRRMCAYGQQMSASPKQVLVCAYVSTAKRMFCSTYSRPRVSNSRYQNVV